ncbi:hypothetical protein ES288_A05G048200v1 [Gossypium darwinii]|uniref:Histidine-containing phosphotransfer protein n=2 Tax=Gossypium TaxID=3633 RepID=A0A5D2QB10_GOSTO|nr:hypothetical protein ES288_A05G048200v1 [Gossypium darwinii]TYI25436.1 hypothetical protein ES332_A05G050100v1 [Gossypium tomentosum]
MDRYGMQNQIACIRRSLFDQGYLDEQFIQLEELQDDANPNFVQEIVTLFYTDSTRLIQNIELTLIGAKKVTSECAVFRQYCAAGNAEACIRNFQHIKQEHAILRKKLEFYFQMMGQAAVAQTT